MTLPPPSSREVAVDSAPPSPRGAAKGSASSSREAAVGLQRAECEFRTCTYANGDTYKGEFLNGERHGNETSLNSITQFREIATKINTQIETLQNTDTEIDIDKLNNLKYKFLKSLILNPNIIERIKPDKIELHLKYYFYYLGEIKDETANGYGTKTYVNGDTYTGEWQKALKHGRGTYTFANGNIYEGTWLNGIWPRQGKLRYADGDIYEGEFINGQPHGYGTETFKNGDTYTGEWQNDMFHGVGKLIYKNGDQYEGDFSEGMFHGQGVLKKANGDIYTGGFVFGWRSCDLKIIAIIILLPILSIAISIGLNSNVNKKNQ